MARCRSWKPVENRPESHARDHLPGDCRKCWRPCFAKVEKGQVRCEQCALAIAQHPSSEVRRLLVAEPRLPLTVAELLVTDFDATVASAAQFHLDRATLREMS